MGVGEEGRNERNNIPNIRQREVERKEKRMMTGRKGKEKEQGLIERKWGERERN